MTVDGQRCSRCDWALAGHTFSGTWQQRGGERLWTLHDDGRFESDTGTGRYQLTTGAISLTWADGTPQDLSVYSDLQPDSARPDALWIGGQPHDLIR